MRTLKGEVIINVPAPTAWEMFMNNEVISKINPDYLAGAAYLQGDGSPGSLRHFKLGPGNPLLKTSFPFHIFLSSVFTSLK